MSWLGFSFLQVLYLKIQQGGSIYKFPWHWDAPFWTFLNSLFGAIVIIFIKRKFDLFSESSKSLWRNFLTCFFVILINAFLVTALPIILLGHSFTGRKNITSYEWVIGFLNSIFPQIFVCFTCVGYFYLNLVNKTKEKLVAAQRAKAEMELKTLQQNIEPHFLFNNLNVLSSLIESNPARANEFLSKMSELYRYILRTQAQEFVPLKEELEFAENYIFLLRERFGAAYDFDWQIAEKDLNGQLIVPVSLQSLIENAVKHNSGNPENPLQIAVRLENEYLAVENEIREKRLTFQTNKSGLQNLQTRYAFLAEKPLEIFQDNKFFRVKLPLIHAE